MTKVEFVVQTPSFKKSVKKLKSNQKRDLDEVIKRLMLDPEMGEKKRGDLGYLRVFKFQMAKQLTLLAYSYENGSVILELLMLGTHENFYRDLKR